VLIWSFIIKLENDTHNLLTPSGGLSRLLVSTDSMASLAPRNSMPDERSSRKVLKLVTPPNPSGSRTSVERRKKRGVRFEVSEDELALLSITRTITNRNKRNFFTASEKNPNQTPRSQQEAEREEEMRDGGMRIGGREMSVTLVILQSVFSSFFFTVLVTFFSFSLLNILPYFFLCLCFESLFLHINSESNSLLRRSTIK